MSFTIAHISDLHLTESLFKVNSTIKDGTIPNHLKQNSNLADGCIQPGSVIDNLKRCLINEKPSVIVVSGDLANGKEKANDGFDFFHKFIGSVTSEIKPSPTIIVVPGNHDVEREKGENNLSSFNSMIKDKFFGILHEWETDKSPKIYREGNCVINTDHKTIFLLFNSSISSGAIVKDIAAAMEIIKKIGEQDELLKRLERHVSEDPGLISDDEINVAEISLQKIKNQQKSYNSFRKIAVFHHHLTNNHRTEFKRYDAIINAGPVKQFLVRHQVHLVLHGHKHEAKIAYERVINSSNAWGIHILGAPSATMHTNEFFLIHCAQDSYTVKTVCAMSGLSKNEEKIIAGCDTATEHPIISWPGYRNIPYINLRAKENKIRFLEHSGIHGNLIEMKLDENRFSLIIDDYDELESLKIRSIHKFEDHGTSVFFKKLSSAVRSVSDKPLHYIPIRCGINALAIRNCVGESCTQKVSEILDKLLKESTSITDILLNKTLHINFAFWDNPNVNVPLLYSYLDIGSINECAADLQRLESQKIFFDKAKEIPTPTIHAEINNLSTDMYLKKIDIVVGGGAWLRRKSHSQDGFITLLPKGKGGLFWIEAAALLKEDPSIKNFAKHLLEEDVQLNLLDTDEFYTAPVVKCERQHIDDSKLIYDDDECSSLNKLLVFRMHHSDSAEIYRKLWNDLKCHWKLQSII